MNADITLYMELLKLLIPVKALTLLQWMFSVLVSYCMKCAQGNNQLGILNPAFVRLINWKTPESKLAGSFDLFRC